MPLAYRRSQLNEQDPREGAVPILGDSSCRSYLRLHSFNLLNSLATHLHRPYSYTHPCCPASASALHRLPLLPIFSPALTRGRSLRPPPPGPSEQQAAATSSSSPAHPSPSPPAPDSPARAKRRPSLAPAPTHAPPRPRTSPRACWCGRAAARGAGRACWTAGRGEGAVAPCTGWGGTGRCAGKRRGQSRARWKTEPGDPPSIACFSGSSRSSLLPSSHSDLLMFLPTLLPHPPALTCDPAFAAATSASASRSAFLRAGSSFSNRSRRRSRRLCRRSEKGASCSSVHSVYGSASRKVMSWPTPLPPSLSHGERLQLALRSIARMPHLPQGPSRRPAPPTRTRDQ
ncbi:hypothetical protein CALCODRAFT_23169 [Calocera cornea HHB12733]|uniref:Uncharacterized protein n=1 Tax=Calocera cornea HHB12733 TaxID=1353952 RepID=A0A165E5P2_9BASI|nr:hypothetical protein CALCODRAFT_23169 [Calocera cornea HHB12733]